MRALNCAYLVSISPTYLPVFVFNLLKLSPKLKCLIDQLIVSHNVGVRETAESGGDCGGPEGLSQGQW